MQECQYSQLKRLDLVLLTGIICLQIFLFTSYIQREVADDVILHGDPTWYTFFSYEIFNHIIDHDWTWLVQKARTMPWGILLWVESAGLQLLLGSGRLSILYINLIYYIVCQIAVFYFFTWFGKAKYYGWIGLFLFLTLATPFTAVALNIRDFHPDLITAFLFTGFFLLLGRSNCFADKRLSVIIGLFAAYTSYMRLVSAFSLVGLFGLFFLIILIFSFIDAENRIVHKNRLINTATAAVIFLVIVTPHLAFSFHALKFHYFRYLFDKDFANIAIPLYNYGLNDAISGIKWILGRIILNDIGLSSLIAFGVVGAVIIINKFFSSKTETEKEYEKNAFSLRMFYIFLAVATAYTCYQHSAFPIKSANLTRLTMTPVFVLTACWMINSLKALNHREQWGKWILVPIVLLSLFAQLNFYARKGRFHDYKMDLLAVGSMYEDIFSYCQKNDLNELGISTDFSDEIGYALGAFMNFYSYAWEKHGILIKPRPQMGSAHDAPFGLEKANDFLDKSDAVVLSSDPYDVKGQWPLNQSVRAIRPELVAKIKKEFVLNHTYKLFGKEKSLYLRQWQISASASTSTFYGPGFLLTEPRIWHAPWDGGKTPQWVMFTTPKPKRLSSISIAAQDGGVDRAPKSFIFQALDENENWISLLDVENANLSSDAMNKSWALKMEKGYRKFRLWITQNNGHPTLLTIKRMNLGFK